MTQLPSLANLFALWNQDPRVLAELAGQLRSRGDFSEVFRPAPNWVCARKYLPDCETDPPSALSAGFVFLEGREELEREIGKLKNRYDELTELVVSSPHKLVRLPGDFAFLHFQANGDAAVVRSVAGFVPLYIRRSAGSTVIATRLIYLQQHMGMRAEPDTLVYGICASGGVLLPDWRSPIKGVRVVPNGSYIRILRGEPAAPQKYFEFPRPARGLPKEACIDARARAMRDAVFGYLERHLHPRRYNLCSFSGGVDSSTVLALAARHFNRPTAAWSLVPGLEPDRSRELSYIEPLLKDLGILKSWKVFLTERTMLELIHGAASTGFPALQQVLLALPGLIKELDIGTVLGGEFADEAFGGVKTYPDLSLAIGLGEAVVLAARGYPRSVARWIKHQLQWRINRPLHPYPLRLSPVLAPAIRSEYWQWVADQQRQAVAGDPCNSYLIRSCDVFWAHSVANWEACTPLGVRRLMPFFNRSVLELACAAHPFERLHDGVKTLLRRAFHDYVPARNLYREDKGYYTHTPLPPPESVSPTQPVRALLAPSLFQNGTRAKLGGYDLLATAALSQWLKTAE